jgi:hypothetical protein
MNKPGLSGPDRFQLLDCLRRTQENVSRSLCSRTRGEEIRSPRFVGRAARRAVALRSSVANFPVTRMGNRPSRSDPDKIYAVRLRELSMVPQSAHVRSLGCPVRRHLLLGDPVSARDRRCRDRRAEPLVSGLDHACSGYALVSGWP